MCMLTYAEGSVLLADPIPHLGARGYAAVPNGTASRGPAACLQLSPKMLGGAGREGQTSVSSWTSGVEDYM